MAHRGRDGVNGYSVRELPDGRAEVWKDGVLIAIEPNAGVAWQKIAATQPPRPVPMQPLAPVPMQPVQKKGNGCLIAGAIVAGVLALFAGCATIRGSLSGQDGQNGAASAAASDPSATSGSSTPPTNAGPASTSKPGPAFAGAKDSDVIGAAGAPLNIGKATVTSTPLVNGNSSLGPTLCTSVTLQNSSDTTISFSIFDWKLQSPSGTIVTTGFTGSKNMLHTGEIAPGGTAKGDVCFDNEPAPGQYVVLYEPTFSFFSNRAAWMNSL